MSALGLLLTSMYVQKHKQLQAADGHSEEEVGSHDPESQVMAMERISVLFDRWVAVSCLTRATNSRRNVGNML